MNHLLTATGAEYSLDGLASLMPNGRPILMRDIAHQAAILVRWNGATKRPFSVAEHALLVSEIAQRDGASLIVQLAALLHDAHAVYLGELPSPIKATLAAMTDRDGGRSNAWRVLEEDHARTLRRFFGVLTACTAHRVKLRLWDLQALATERRDLTAWTSDKHQAWLGLGDGLDHPELTIAPVEWLQLDSDERDGMTWRDWRDAFETRFESIMVGIGSDPSFRSLA